MAVTTMPASAATCSKSCARQRPSACSTASRVAPSPVGQPSNARAPSRWCGKLAWMRTQPPSPQRYTPVIGSRGSGEAPLMRKWLRHSCAACSMSTPTCCRSPPRRCHNSAAASAAAAMLTWAAVPTVNEEGSTGSLPISTTCSSDSPGRSKERHRSCNTSPGVLAAGARPLRKDARKSIRCPMAFIFCFVGNWITWRGPRRRQ